MNKELLANQEKCLFFNLDISSDFRYFDTQDDLLKKIKQEVGLGKAYIFIDEIQRIENAGLFLKGLYDRSLPYKWIVTGSGSLKLKEKIAESLVGRKRNFYVPTISIHEFCAFKTDYKYDNLPEILASEETLEENLLKEFMIWGGYPRVVTSVTSEDKKAILAEIYQGYIERDIQLLLRLEKSREFILLLQLIANRSGQMINFSNLAGMTNLSSPTLKKYLWYGEKTFVIKEVTPYYRNKEKEVTQSPQYYFNDSGLQGFLLNRLFEDSLQTDMGFKFQQLVFHMLFKLTENTISTIHYWRTQNQTEVNFILNYGLEIIPIEVKANKMKIPKIERSLRSFIDIYKPNQAWVVNRTLKLEIKIDQTTIRFLPWYDLFDMEIVNR